MQLPIMTEFAIPLTNKVQPLPNPWGECQNRDILIELRILAKRFSSIISSPDL